MNEKIKNILLNSGLFLGIGVGLIIVFVFIRSDTLLISMGFSKDSAIVVYGPLLMGATLVLLLVVIPGLLLKKSFNDAAKEKCYYCGDELGQEYHDGETSWKDNNDEELWAHNRCIPLNDRDEWTNTE